MRDPNDRVVLRLPSLLAATLLFGACDSGDVQEPEVARTAKAEAAKTPMAPPPGAGEALSVAAQPSDVEPADTLALLEGLEPVKTRAGHLRFTAEAISDPQASAVFARRLAEGATARPERLALAEALHRSGGDWPAAILAQLAVEDDPEVRAILVSTLAKAPLESALAGLRIGLADPKTSVRRAACELAGWAPLAGRDASVQAPLAAALGDADAGVRSAAARAWGLLGDAERFDSIAAGLEDGDAEVRLQSLRALQRIDPQRAAKLPAISSLTGEAEADVRVRRAATKLRAAGEMTDD